MFQTLCALLVRICTVRLAWASMKELNKNNKIAPVEQQQEEVLDVELLQLWCWIAFHSVWVLSGLEFLLAKLVPFYYFFKLISFVATFTPGTKVPSFLFEVVVIPTMERLHTLLTTDVPSLLHCLMDELQLLPFKLIDWFLLPGAFCLDLSLDTPSSSSSSSVDPVTHSPYTFHSFTPENNDNKIEKQMITPNHDGESQEQISIPPKLSTIPSLLVEDEFSTPPVTTSTSIRTPLAPMKVTKRASSTSTNCPYSTNNLDNYYVPTEEEDNYCPHPEQQSLYDSPTAACHLYPHMESSSSPIVVTRPLPECHDPTTSLRRRRSTSSSSNNYQLDSSSPIDTQEHTDDDNQTIQSMDNTPMVGSPYYPIRTTTTPVINEPADTTTTNPKTCRIRGRSSSTSSWTTRHVRAILTGSSDTSIREFYLDLRVPLSPPSDNNGTNKESTNHPHLDAIRVEPLHPSSSQQPTSSSTSLVSSTTTTTTNRRSARIVRKKLTYYR